MTETKSDESPKQYDEVGRSIAFLDILGFSEHVKRAQDPAHFSTLLGGLRTVKSVGDAWPTAVAQEGIPPEEMQKAMDFRTHTFSDSIVLSERGQMVAPLIFAVARLAMALLKDCIFIRGGIAVGKLHHDDAVVFGPAFLEAYELEHTAAKYPRVLLSDGALEIARQNGIKFPGYALTHKVDAFAARDADGLYYVDFLKIALAAPEAVAGVPKRQLLGRIVPALTYAQKQRDEAPSQYIRANSGWLANYLDTFVSTHLVTIG